MRISRYNLNTWESVILILAGMHSIFWGTWTVFFHEQSFAIYGLTKTTHYIEFWRCLGIVTGLYGVGLLLASTSPARFWPIVLVGLLGKLTGLVNLHTKRIGDSSFFSFDFLFYDLMWIFLFALILFKKFKSNRPMEEIKVNLDNLEKLSKRERAQFVNTLSGFKSVNLVGTVNDKGKTNLSIISSAFHLGSDPALIGFIIRPDISPRHTLMNIRANKKCTLNHVNENIFRQAHQTSARYQEGHSEFNYCELIEEYKDNFLAPFVGESNISMSVEIQNEIKIEENGTHLLIGKISNVYLPKGSLSSDGSINLLQAQTVCLSGLNTYYRTTKLDKLSYAKPLEKIKSI